MLNGVEMMEARMTVRGRKGAGDESVEEREGHDEGAVTKERVEDTDTEVSNKLALGEEIDETLEALLWKKRILRDGYNGDIVRADFNLRWNLGLGG